MIVGKNAHKRNAGHARALDLGGQRRAVVVGRGPLRQRRERRVRRLRKAREERVLAERREARAARLEARAAAAVVGRGRGRAGDAVGRVVVRVVACSGGGIRRVVDEQDLARHLVGLGAAVGRLRGRAARLVARGEVRGERGAGQRRAEAARHRECVGAVLLVHLDCRRRHLLQPLHNMRGSARAGLRSKTDPRNNSLSGVYRN